MSDNEDNPLVKPETGPDQLSVADFDASGAGAAGTDDMADAADGGNVGGDLADEPTAGPSNSTLSTTLGAGGEGSHVKIRIEFQDNVDVYKIKKEQSFKKLINKFCARHGVDINYVRFIYDGKKLRPTDTPLTMGMEEEEETVEVFTEQTGGKVI